MKNSRKYSRSFRPKPSVQQTSSDTEPYIGESGVMAAFEVDTAVEADSFIQSLIRHSMFWSPTYSDGDWNDYAPLAFWLVDMLRPQLVVEAGNVSPVSYFALCQAVQRLGLNAQCVAIDTTTAQVDFLRCYAEKHYHAFSSVTSKESFEDASGNFQVGTIGLLHLNLPAIDGATSNQSVENWLSRVMDDGLVLISGTGIQSGNEWLRDTLSRLKADYSIFEFPHGIGVSLVSLGRNLPEPLASLFGSEESNNARAGIIREIFSRLGKGCADAQALSLLKTNTATSSSKIIELQKFNETVSKADAERIATLTADIEGMRQHAIVMEDELLQSRKAVSEHTSKINTLELELKQADAVRDRQTQEIATLTTLLLQTEEKLEKIQVQFATATSIAESAEQASVVPDRKQGRLPSLLRVFAGNSRNSEKKIGGAKFLQAQKLVRDSALFDEKWYLSQYSDVAASNLSPVEHYLTIGAALGYDPSANFQTSYYLDKYQDVAASGMNPLVHYLRFGIGENRKPKAN